MQTILIIRVATRQGKNEGKTKFSPGQGIVREFWKMSGNFCHLTHVRELSGNFVMTFFLD